MRQATSTCVRCTGPLTGRRWRFCSDSCNQLYNFTWDGHEFSEESKRIVGRWNAIKSRAQVRGYEFDLTLNFLSETIKRPCIYCGGVGPIHVDRKDSSQGYLQANCVPACWRCNFVKNRILSFEEMIIVAKALGWCKGRDARRGGQHGA